MTKVNADEFAANAAGFFDANRIVINERNNEAIGFYAPGGQMDHVHREQAFERLEESVQRVLDETGMTEDELARWFDLGRPLPEDDAAPSTNVALVGARATGR